MAEIPETLRRSADLAPEASLHQRAPAAHSRLAMASCCLGVLSALAWLSIPIVDKTMSLGEPLGSMLFVLPTVVLAILATLLATGLGIACFLRPASSPKKKTGALVGILLSLASPLVLWAIAVLWL